MEVNRTSVEKNLRIFLAKTIAGKSSTLDCYEFLESGAPVWRVLGIFPMTIKGSIGSRKYELNKLYAIYSCSMFFASAFSIIQIISTWRDEVKMVTANVWLRTFSSLLSLLIAIIWRIFRHNELSKLIETIAAQESVLRKMNSRLYYESDTKRVRAYVWTTAMTVVFLVGYNRYYYRNPGWRENIKWIVFTFPLAMQIVDLTLFVSLVGLLGLHFRALNDRIKAVAMRANISSPKVIVTSDVCAKNLQLIAKTHYNICAIAKRINSFFDWDVIVNVITAFIILSVTLYYIFVEVQHEGKIDYFRIGTYIQWELIHSVPIIGVVIICNWTSNQAIHAEKLIHEIRVIETDSRLYESVKSFSLQLHHQNLEFNAFGFFPLNSGLLQTIVGNITTYLVLLIQFQPKLE